MASGSANETTIIIIAATAGGSLILATCFFVWRKRKRAARGLTADVELPYGSGVSGYPNLFTPGRARELSSNRSHWEEQALPSPYTHARDPPDPPRRSRDEEYGAFRRPQQQREEYGAIRRPTTSREGMKTQRQHSLSIDSAHQHGAYQNNSTPRYGIPKAINHGGEVHASRDTPHKQIQPSYSSTYKDPIPNVATAVLASSTPTDTILDSSQGSQSASYLYHSHLHPSPATTHLQPPRRFPTRFRSASHSSAASVSSAGSTISMTRCVNPIYAAAQRAHRAAPHKSKKRDWRRYELGSEDSSSVKGVGWVVKGKFPNIASIIAGANEGEASIQMSPLRQATSHSKNPVREGTPKLETISDVPRGAPMIRSVGSGQSHHRQRSDDRTWPAARENGHAEVQSAEEGPPDVYGRGSMTDQSFVPSHDRDRSVSARRQGPRRDAVRVDAKGRIVRP